MTLSRDEQDRIGLALYLTHHEYNEISEGWEFELPTYYKMSVEALMRCRYVAFSIDAHWDAIGKIGAWRVSMDGDGKKTAELSAISKSVRGLSRVISSNITKIQWLNEYQLEAVETAMADEPSITRPEVFPACLDMEEASDAIARRYGVEATQIQISIHRKVTTGQAERQE
ncbi:hypothetical protein [Pseudomonas siliginis]|uniref:hypothetical protein n=1 Tax=Pseudomonas siliginis TaxID=2842346 RepID=UPI0020923539|nr:hypothetical protein [Pseudomonas siliginis]UST92741.1 hypothetical protein NF678_12725 [Pseudomonas siliginis]